MINFRVSSRIIICYILTLEVLYVRQVQWCGVFFFLKNKNIYSFELVFKAVLEASLKNWILAPQ